MEQPSLVLSCIVPHGAQIIAVLAQDDPDCMATTRASMQEVGAQMRAAQPDVIVVLTPHGIRASGQFVIANCERMTGVLTGDAGASISMERSVDRDLATQLQQHVEAAHIPVAAVNFATSEGPLSSLPLDWGVIVPLYFMPEVPIVVVTPARDLPMTECVRFGEALLKTVELSGKRVGLVASCDWSHTHRADGPYGFHTAAKELDEAVAHAISDNALERLLDFSPEWIEDAKPDGLWQTLILAGALPASVGRPRLISYEAPTYFGLLCATYQ